MTYRKFTIYDEPNIVLRGYIEGKCLHLESTVYGEEFDSEKHYSFSEEDTDKLFLLMSLEQFTDFCRKSRLSGLEKFLTDNNIHPKTFTI